MFCKDGKNMETGSSPMPLCATVFLTMNAVTISELPEIRHVRARLGERAYRQVCSQRVRNVTVSLGPLTAWCFILPISTGGMYLPLNDFLAQTRQNLDPDEEVIFNYDDAPAY